MRNGNLQSITMKFLELFLQISQKLSTVWIMTFWLQSCILIVYYYISKITKWLFIKWLSTNKSRNLVNCKTLKLVVCSSHVTYAFQRESTLYSFLNLKELLARSRCEIWRFRDWNCTRTQNHLIRKRTLSHLAKMVSSPVAVIETGAKDRKHFCLWFVFNSWK